MENIVTDIPTTETGALGILHLKRFRNETLRLLDRNRTHKPPEEHNLNKILLHGLGIGFTEPNRFLFENKPTYEEFENWIVKTLGGNISPEIIEKTNGQIRGYLAGNQKEKVYPLSTTINDPVFSKQDMEFWHENGYIVLREAITQEDAKATEAAIWEFTEQNLEDSNTWSGQGYNFWVPMYQHPTFKKNRQSKRIQKAFAQLWGTEDLVCEINRASMNFPVIPRGFDKSGPSTIHWDISLSQPVTFDLLGIIYLSDTKEEQGAFQCIPGFHHRIENWLNRLSPDLAPREEILKEADTALRIAGKAGDLIICRHELPHGCSVNRGTYPRICQYISMFPPDFPVNPVWK